MSEVSEEHFTWRWGKPLQKSSSTPHYDTWRRLETSLQDVWATHGNTFSMARKNPVLLDSEAAQTPGCCFKESRVQKCDVWINFPFSRFCKMIIQHKFMSFCNKITCNRSAVFNLYLLNRKYYQKKIAFRDALLQEVLNFCDTWWCL